MMETMKNDEIHENMATTTRKWLKSRKSDEKHAKNGGNH